MKISITASNVPTSNSKTAIPARINLENWLRKWLVFRLNHPPNRTKLVVKKCSLPKWIVFKRQARARTIPTLVHFYKYLPKKEYFSFFEVLLIYVNFYALQTNFVGSRFCQKLNILWNFVTHYVVIFFKYWSSYILRRP